MISKNQPMDKKNSLMTETELAVLSIKNELLSSCSLQVSDSNYSPISSAFDFSETSFDLSAENFSLEDILQLEKQYSINHTNPIVKHEFEQFLKSNPEMTFNVYSNDSMEQNDTHPTVMPIGSSPMTDESTNSSHEDFERDMVNRRGLKKSGGPVRKLARFGNKQVIKYSDEYHDRRVKNNEAVKKSRMKAKGKQKETEDKLKKLSQENHLLVDRVDHLLKELQLLKSLYKEINQDMPHSAVQALQRINVNHN